MDKHARRKSDSGITIVLFMGTENYVERKQQKVSIISYMDKMVLWLYQNFWISPTANQDACCNSRVRHLLSCQQETVLMAQNAYNIILYLVQVDTMQY